uniref:hypothetical protein n=1 Tax=Taibaiella koreensis TaxID=1268548 RepID=UPI0013C30E8F
MIPNCLRQLPALLPALLLLPAALWGQDLDGTPASNKAQTEATRSGGGNGASSLYSPNLFDGSVDI